MRVVFFGSGEFAVPTLRHLRRTCDVVRVVSQPDRPAGRSRRMTPTPVSAESMSAGCELERLEDINTPDSTDRLRAIDADAWVVIAFGQKFSEHLLVDRFAINLHGSLLPRWRGAAPIHHAVLAGDPQTGVSVITLDQVMDAGLILGQSPMDIAATDTTGDLHDALASMGPALVQRILDEHAAEGLKGESQDLGLVTQAPRLGRGDAVLDLQSDADSQRCLINGMSPWPGCRLKVAGEELRLLRAGPTQAHSACGQLGPDGTLGLAEGSLQLLEVQPAGGRPMAFDAWARGRRLDDPVQVEMPS